MNSWIQLVCSWNIANSYSVGRNKTDEEEGRSKYGRHPGSRGLSEG